MFSFFHASVSTSLKHMYTTFTSYRQSKSSIRQFYSITRTFFSSFKKQVWLNIKIIALCVLFLKTVQASKRRKKKLMALSSEQVMSADLSPSLLIRQSSLSLSTHTQNKYFRQTESAVKARLSFDTDCPTKFSWL